MFGIRFADRFDLPRDSIQKPSKDWILFHMPEKCSLEGTMPVVSRKGEPEDAVSAIEVVINVQCPDPRLRQRVNMKTRQLEFSGSTTAPAEESIENLHKMGPDVDVPGWIFCSNWTTMMTT